MNKQVRENYKYNSGDDPAAIIQRGYKEKREYRAPDWATAQKKVTDWHKEIVLKVWNTPDALSSCINGHQANMNVYPNNVIDWAKRVWKKWCDKDGLIQKDKFHQFILDHAHIMSLNHHTPQNWADFYDAANKLDTRYEGITLKDFIDTVVQSEWSGCKMVLNQPIDPSMYPGGQ